MSKPSGCFGLVIALALLGCGSSGPATFEAHGDVVDVLVEDAQVVVAHEDVPGLMPAMTMSFDVPDPEVLGSLSAGQHIRFRIEKTERSYRIVEVEVMGEAGRSGEAPRSRSTPAAALDPAPGFRLLDQHGRTIALDDLRGRTVVLDFIFTNCPGPCPTLTGIQKDVREALSPDERARTRFVSITLDPERDTPEALRDYAAKRGIEGDDWHLLTGPSDEVNAVVRSYGVGVIRRAGIEPEHLVVTFVIDPRGEIADRILGLDPSVEERVARVARTLRRRPRRRPLRGARARKAR